MGTFYYEVQTREFGGSNSHKVVSFRLFRLTLRLEADLSKYPLFTSIKIS